MVGKNNTGAIRKFYELVIKKAQRLEFTTHLACFVKYEKNYFVKLILYRPLQTAEVCTFSRSIMMAPNPDNS